MFGFSQLFVPPCSRGQSPKQTHRKLGANPSKARSKRPACSVQTHRELGANSAIDAVKVFDAFLACKRWSFHLQIKFICSANKHLLHPQKIIVSTSNRHRLLFSQYFPQKQPSFSSTKGGIKVRPTWHVTVSKAAHNRI